jgi:NAD(P)-dependent dehydrogenase (short-subunit alcohol dehydrogenase family)
MSLEGRVALVTGGGRGIGRGISLALAEAGADVAIVYRRNEESAIETAKGINALSRKAEIFHCDVTEYDSVKEVVKQVIESLGKIDILVNNAGIASRGNSVFNTDIDELRRVIDTHVFGSFHFTQSVLPNMRQQPRGDIIFISSGAAEGGGANGAPYGMAKRAMEALAAALSREELANGIRVNVVRPGLVETDMGARLVKATRGVQNIKELYPSSPFGRVGQPSDIGNAVAFLVSQKGEYITNAVIKVSGG